MKIRVLLMLVIIVVFVGNTYGHDGVPEATTCFRQPLDNWWYHGGYQYSDWSTTSTCYHPGADYNGYPYSGDGDLGMDVLAVADGKVVDINTTTDFGLCMVIEHHYFGDTVYSQYGHLQSVLVAEGDNVTKGQHIAELGHSGTGAGTDNAHLHWEIRKGRRI